MMAATANTMNRGGNYNDGEMLALTEAVNRHFETIFDINKGAEVIILNKSFLFKCKSLKM